MRFQAARSSIDGRPRLVSYRRVEGFPLYVLVSLAHADVLAEWQAQDWAQATAGAAGGLARLRQAFGDRLPPVIVLSKADTPVADAAAMGLPVAATLSKPVTPSSLLDVLVQLLSDAKVPVPPPPATVRAMRKTSCASVVPGAGCCWPRTTR